MKQDAIGSMDDASIPLDTELDKNYHAPYDEPQPAMQSHLSDLPSDLALNQYSFTTYARLEDVVRGGSGGGVVSKKAPDHRNRHDSHHPSTDDDHHRTHLNNSFDVHQVAHASSDGHEDDDSGFEIRFKKLGVGHTNGLHEGVEGNRAGHLSLQKHDTDTSQSPASNARWSTKPSFLASGIDRVPEDFSESDFSEDFGFYADDEDDEQQPSAEGNAPVDQPTAQHQPTTSLPLPPPEPERQPVTAPDASPEPNLPPFSPPKRHTRARSFPLRLKQAHRSIPPPNPAAAPSFTRPNVPPPNPAAAPSLARCSAVAPRFTGFANLPSSSSCTNLAPVHPRPPPIAPAHAHAHPHPHFAPKPAPLPLPLPRRQSVSRPPVVVDPAQDAFYCELKSKLWKLAQELEARGSERVVGGAGVGDGNRDGDRDRVFAYVSSPPSPDAAVLEDEVDSEELAEFFAADELLGGRRGGGMVGGPVGGVRGGMGVGGAEDEGSAVGSGMDSEGVEEVEAEVEDWRVKQARLEALGHRRASEGRGRKWARERAQRGYKKWLRVPD